MHVWVLQLGYFSSKLQNVPGIMNFKRAIFLRSCEGMFKFLNADWNEVGLEWKE